MNTNILWCTRLGNYNGIVCTMIFEEKKVPAYPCPFPKKICVLIKTQRRLRFSQLQLFFDPEIPPPIAAAGFQMLRAQHRVNTRGPESLTRSQ